MKQPGFRIKVDKKQPAWEIFYGSLLTHIITINIEEELEWRENHSHWCGLGPL